MSNIIPVEKNSSLSFCQDVTLELNLFNHITHKKMAQEFTDSNFQSTVLASDKPVLVDFWAEWCGPCRMIGPLVEEISHEYEGKALVGKLNVDENPEVAQNYGIRSIPTLLVFKGGQLVDKIVGAVPKSTIAQKLEAQLS